VKAEADERKQEEEAGEAAAAVDVATRAPVALAPASDVDAPARPEVADFDAARRAGLVGCEAAKKLHLAVRACGGEVRGGCVSGVFPEEKLDL
jgi:hypothetical protein